MLEEISRGEIEAGSPASRNHLNCQDRVAAKLEEVIRYADLLQSKHLSPDVGNNAFGIRAWRNVGPCDAVLQTVVAARGRQSISVEFAIGVERQRVEEDEVGWQHVIGQLGAEGLAQLVNEAGRGAVCHEIGNETLLAGDVLARDHGDVGDLGGSGDGGLDLAKLDAEAADL